MKTLIRILLVAYCFFSSAFSFGQEIEWQNTIGGSGDDLLNTLSQTNDGGYILSGMSISDISGDKSENSNGDFDCWVIKLDSTGNIQWQNTIGGNLNDGFSSIKQTNDGGYICGGASESDSTGDKTEPTNGLYDFWVVKLDASGNIQWQNAIGGYGDEQIIEIEQTADGGYICGGFSGSDISGDKTEDVLGIDDYWIVKLDSAGNIQWQNTIQANGYDVLVSIHQTSDGGFICGGYSDSDISVDKTENSQGNIDYWIFKLDTTGNIQWQNTIGGNAEDYLTSLSLTNDNGYILSGYSYSSISGDKTEDNNGVSDFWIVKTDSTGNIQWQNTIGGDLADILPCIKQKSDGGYIVAGSSTSTLSGDKTENKQGDDYWILNLDSLGNIIWQNTIGGSQVDAVYSIIQTNDDGFLIGGYSGSDISGDKTENTVGGGYYDFWIVKLFNHYNSISGITFADLNNNNIKDIGEPFVKQEKLTEQNTGRFAFSEQNGNYIVAVLDTGNFTITPSPVSYYNVTPLNHTATFSGGLQQTDSLNDFAFQPTGVFNDLCITITPLSFFRIGFDASYIINYENVGTTTLNPIIKLFPDTNLSFVSCFPVATNVNIDSIEWNIGTLTPFQSGTIMVTFNVSSTSTIGSTCNTTVHIEPIAGDANPSCNFDTSSVLISSSYDPNDILVNEGAILTTQLPSQPWLDYTIRFQNTGNDTAFTVNVLNPIDTTKLELSSIEFVNSSHPVNLNWIPWERNMEFKFNNILLPDSNINEPLSHGFVHYRIKPKTTLLAGDSISNNAYIYFDFNAPVATNTAITRIVLPSGISNLQFTNYDLKVFPNPAKEEITIAGYALQNNRPAVLKIYDVMGKEVFSQFINRTSQIVNLKLFTNGVYFVQLQTGAKVSRVKFIKQ